MAEFNFVENTFMVPYTEEVADYRDPFCCGDEDLDELNEKFLIRNAIAVIRPY